MGEQVIEYLQQSSALPDGYVIYTKPTCRFCKAAKALLREMGKPFLEKDITEAKHSTEMYRHVPNAKTVPQIFLDGVHVGGFSELYAQSGFELDANDYVRMYTEALSAKELLAISSKHKSAPSKDAETNIGLAIEAEVPGDKESKTVNSIWNMHEYPKPSGFAWNVFFQNSVVHNADGADVNEDASRIAFQTKTFSPEDITSSEDMFELMRTNFEQELSKVSVGDELCVGEWLNVASLFASIAFGCARWGLPLIKGSDWLQIASTASTVATLGSPSALISP